MIDPVKKAMVLSAGLGTRLNPITQKLPKPLVSVLNIPNILHILFILKRAGINDVVMNLFHLSERMEEFFLQRKFFEMNFFFTHEDPIQGTGGGVKNAEKFLNNSTFILANCDFVTNIDINYYLEKHFSTKSLASMLLIQDPSRQPLYSKVGIDPNERLVSLPKLQTQTPNQFGIFTGIHILNPEILSFLQAGPCGINDTLYPRLMKEYSRAVHGFIDSKAFWYDTGDISAFFQTSRQLLERLLKRDPFITDLFLALDTPYEEIKPGIWIERGFSLPSYLKISGPAIIGKNIEFGKNCQVGPYSIIGENCSLEEKTSVKDSILLAGSRVHENSHLSHIIQFEDLSLSSKISV